MIFDVIVGSKQHRLELNRKPDQWICRLDGREIAIDARRIDPDRLSLVADGRVYEIRREQIGSMTRLHVGRREYLVEVRDPRALVGRKRSGAGDSGPKKVVASMPGRVLRVVAAEKATIEAGQPILVLEAMKMQNEIASPKTGVIQKLFVVEGGRVNAGDVLAIVE